MSIDASIEEHSICYTAKVIKQEEIKPGCWKHSDIAIYAHKKNSQSDKVEEYRIGGYQRNYPSYGVSTFCPFKLDNKWYALYSKDYMYTRVMSLPDCKDLGGEDASNTEYNSHFCPTEYIVPNICVMQFSKEENDPRPYNPRQDRKKWNRSFFNKKNNKFSVYPDNEKAHRCFSKEEIKEYKDLVIKSDSESELWYERHPFIPKYADFGFVSGCQWGDDDSWKVQFLDLKQASKGIIKRDSRFGYIELPENVKLKDAISIRNDEQDRYMTWEDFKVQIAVPAYFNINSGKEYDKNLTGWWDDEMKNPSYKEQGVTDDS